jgi:hypothetical protein
VSDVFISGDVWILEALEAVILISLFAWIYGLSRFEYRQSIAPGTEHVQILPGAN